MVDLALKNLLHDKLRFFITVAGVAFAVTLVFVQAGLFFGLLSKATITIEKLDADIWVTSHNTPNVDFSQVFSEARVQRIRSIAGVERADNLIVFFMPIVLPSGAQENIMLYALEDFKRWQFPWHLLEGDVSELRRGNFMILDDYANRRFGQFQVGDYREVQNQRLKIIGRSQGALSFTTSPIAFASFDLTQRLMPSLLIGNTTYIIVKIKANANIVAIQQEMARRLPYNDVLTKAEWIQKSQDYWIKTTGIGMNMILTVFLGCLVGVVVVAQTLYTSVMEHLKEYAVVKAIGGNNLMIYQLLAKQALIAAVVGFVFGSIPAFALRPLIAKLDLELLITRDLVIAVFIGTVVLCLAAAMLSFRKVAAVDPALVFRG